MSSEKLILDYIEAKIASVTGAPIPSRHYYDKSKADNARDKYIFAVRPGATSNVTGTVQSVTLEQDFELQIWSDFISKSENDKSAREAIEKIDSFVEQLYPKFTHKISPIILVNPFEKSSPEVDQNDKFVTRTYTTRIKYRISLKGAP